MNSPAPGILKDNTNRRILSVLWRRIRIHTSYNTKHYLLRTLKCSIPLHAGFVFHGVFFVVVVVALAQLQS